MTLQGNMLIGQSGGPTAVINQSLAGAVLEAKKHKAIRGIFGASHGMQGILDEAFFDLRKETKAGLEAVAGTPAAALGSARKKPTPDECARVFEILKRYDIRYFFYIGGNDSAEAAHLINENARRVGYELACWHIPKTIDNDLRENDHTPGFGSAARFVATAVMGDTLDCRALPGVKIDVIMGRHAGFLTAASALARVRPDDGPHLIYLPERPFSFDRFASDVEAVSQKLGYCVVAVSEGIADEAGETIATKFASKKEVDGFGNVQLGGVGSLGDLLATELKARTRVTRVRADTFGYLQRSFPGVVSAVDAREARKAGETAVKFSLGAERSGTVVIRRKPGKAYGVTYASMPLASVAKETKHMPDAFINAAGNDVTPAFLDYVRPLAGPLPKIGRLKAVPVPKRVG
jgi:6-phosphofructokinase